MTEHHVHSLLQYGFTIVKGCVDDRMTELNASLNGILKDDDGKSLTSRKTIFNKLDADEWASCFKPGHQLHEILAGIEANQAVQNEANILVGDSTWHRDGRHVPARAYRVVFYMEQQTPGRGTLLMVPGSHKRQEYWTQESHQIIEKANDNLVLNPHPWAVELISQPGDAMIFHCGVTHASFGGTLRRQAAFVFVGDAVSKDDKELRTSFIMNRMLTGTQIFT